MRSLVIALLLVGSPVYAEGERSVAQPTDVEADRGNSGGDGGGGDGGGGSGGGDAGGGDGDGGDGGTPEELGGGGRPVDKGSFGVGIVLGEPTGISAKLYLEDDRAIQAALGFNFYGSGIQINAEYLFHPWIVQERDAFVLPIYIGPGLRFIQYDGGRGEENHYAVGLRGVVGMLFDFKEVPLDVFLEVGGVLEYDFTEGVGPALNIGAGVRYYF